MGKLSLLPKIIVTTMQIALAALILLAVVPLAMGGLDVDGYDDSKIEYKDYEIVVNLEAEITTDLYFDITGFYCDAAITAGGESIIIPGVEMTIPKNGTTPFKFDAKIPITTFMAMALLAAENDSDIVVTVNIRGSTLNGMITASVSVDTVITEGLGASFSKTDGNINAKFPVPDSETLHDLLEELAPGGGDVTIEIGGVEYTLTYDPIAKTVEIDITYPPGSSIIDAIEGATDVTYDHGAPEPLAEELKDSMIEVMKILGCS